MSRTLTRRTAIAGAIELIIGILFTRAPGMSLARMPASLSAVRQGSMVFFTRSSTSDSSLARVSLMFRCLGPEASAVMYGRLTSV